MPGKLPTLSTYETRVEAARDCGIGGALNDGAAVGEEGDFVGLVPELEHEFVVAHGAVDLQPGAELGEIDGPLAFVDLDRVAAAERDMRTAFTRQVHEVTPGAGAAIGARPRHHDLGTLVA